DRLWALAPLVRLGIERNAHTFVERADARALDGGHMNEHVLTALVRCNEAEALGLIEELDSSSLPHARSPCPRSGGVSARLHRRAPMLLGRPIRLSGNREVRSRSRRRCADSISRAQRNPPGPIGRPNSTEYLRTARI